MTMKLADDFTAIARRLTEIKGHQPARDRNGGTWMPRCHDCMDTGHRRILIAGSSDWQSWQRVICPSCLNPEGKA